MINAYCKKLKYKRKIVLVTNGTGYMNNEGIEDIQEKIKGDGIEFTVMYVFCRPQSFGPG